MLIETMSMDFRKARSVNQTSSSYVSKIPTNTEPRGDAATATGSSIIELCDKNGLLSQNAILILPYAIGSDNNTFNVRVIGWKRTSNNSATLLWIPVNLAEFACTCSAVVGVTGMDVLGTERFADTMTVVVGSTLAGEAASENLVSPANDTIAHTMLDLKGFQKVELSFTTGSSATSCNALICLF